MQIKDLVKARGPVACSLIDEYCKTSIRRAVVTTRVEDCDKVEIPDSWKQLLHAQADSVPLPWDVVWSPAQTWFSALRQLVIKKCCGIGVMIEGRHAPSLVYVFVFAESDGAWTFRGSLPRDVSEAAKSASLDLPSEFTAFYQTVHNGFQDVMEAELMPFMSTTMGKLVSEEDAFGRSKKKPYVLADLIPIYNTGSGDYICLDKQSSTSAKVIGGTYDHESPRDSVFNKDVKSLIDQRFEIALTNYASPER